MPHVREQRRKHSRSLSPVPSKHKRSWQNSPERFSSGGGMSRSAHRHRSPSLVRSDKKDFRPVSKFSGRRDHPGGVRKSRSPHNQRAPRPRSPELGRRSSSSFPKPPALKPPSAGRDKGPLRSEDRSGSRYRHGSDMRPAASVPEGRLKHESKGCKSSPSPERGPSAKKKSRHSQSPIGKRESSKPYVSSSKTKMDTSSSQKSGVPQRTVSSNSKKKAQRMTLHKRFTFDEQEPFELEENVTIAILRKPDAQPSEDVTVKKIFDPAQFKMIYKKSDSQKPIFDRPEIKAWHHDENLEDDPDFERRLVRVKSTSATSKPAPTSLSQMSPDVIRKAIGLQTTGKSNQSPHREPLIRLDPKPDPRYESKYRQQLERQEGQGGGKRRSEHKRRGSADRRVGSDNRGGKGDVRERKGEDERRERSKEETYDLRQALERRRSDREESSFRIEVRRDSNAEAELFYKDGQGPGGDHRSFIHDSGGDRNVVVDQDRARRRFGGSMERQRGYSQTGRRFSDSRGYRGRGSVKRDWNVKRGDHMGGQRQDTVIDFRDGTRNFGHRPRYSTSPPNHRGWRGGFRGRGDGRMQEFHQFDQEIVSPTEIDDSFKYSQHDDRDVSPKSFRGRGSRGRFGPRNFGGTNFRASGYGSYRGGGRGYSRGGYRGRGFGSQGDRRSVDRLRDVSLDREWKHDMYDSLLAEEDMPHSTTVGM